MRGPITDLTLNLGQPNCYSFKVFESDSKVDLALHPSGVDEMSTRNFSYQDLVVKGKLLVVALRQLNQIHKKGACFFFLKT